MRGRRAPLLLLAAPLRPSPAAGLPPAFSPGPGRASSAFESAATAGIASPASAQSADVDEDPGEWERVAAEVEDQLGYLPPNLVGVTCRTALRRSPVALRAYPLNGGAKRRRTRARAELTPFPTLYWLSDPDICRAVADLERRGTVGMLEERLRADPELVRAHERAHEDYARERWGSLLREDREMLERAAAAAAAAAAATKGGQEERGGGSSPRSPRVTAGMVDMIRSSGIAGRARPFGPTIKCLHCHYAHYRSGGTGNVVGRWTDELLREEFPDLDL